MFRPYKTTLNQRESQKKYREKNKEAQNDATEQWREEHPDYNKNYLADYRARMFTYKGKRIPLENIARTGVCSACDSTDKQTVLHHTQYDDNDMLKHTIELCVSCHTTEHHRIRNKK